MKHGSFIGAGRYCAERWVGSHPDVRPCDLYKPAVPMAGYHGLENALSMPMQWHLAPREKMEFYVRYQYTPTKNILGWGIDLASRVAEWDAIYGAVPGKDSWVWNYFSTASLKKLKQKHKYGWLGAEQMKILTDRYDNVTLF